MTHKNLPKTYEENDHQLQVIQNQAIKDNTKITKWTFWVSIVVGIFSAVSALAEVIQLLR